MFRICLARSGSYFVQMFNGSDYKMVGPFFKTKAGARNYAKGMLRGRQLCPCVSPTVNVVEYV